MGRSLVGVVVPALLLGSAVGADAERGSRTSERCSTSWRLVGSDSFALPSGLTRSQGVSSDGDGWVFSWLGGLERTDDRYLTRAANTWPATNSAGASASPDGTNHFGGTHVGDIDIHDGVVYAPIEDGSFNVLATNLNSTPYQDPYIALYDAKTLLWTGKSYHLPVSLQNAGVPWVAVDGRHHEIYTDEWNMPHDRLNVYDMTLHFKRFLPLVYPAELGAGFRLDRVQGAKVRGHQLFVTRDDADKTLFTIDLRTGVVQRLFSLNPSVPAELEGLTFRHTADGAELHVITILDNNDYTKIRAQLSHYAPVRPSECGANAGR